MVALTDNLKGFMFLGSIRYGDPADRINDYSRWPIGYRIFFGLQQKIAYSTWKRDVLEKVIYLLQKCYPARAALVNLPLVFQKIKFSQFDQASFIPRAPLAVS